MKTSKTEARDGSIVNKRAYENASALFGWVFHPIQHWGFNLWFPTLCRSIEGSLENLAEEVKHRVQEYRITRRSLRKRGRVKQREKPVADIELFVLKQVSKETRYAAIVLAFSFCEGRFIQICEAISDRLYSTRERYDKAHGYHENLDGARKYMKNLGLNVLGDSCEWKELVTLHRLRNLIVHHGGNLMPRARAERSLLTRRENLINYARSYARAHPDRISLDRGESLYVESYYLEWVRIQINTYFKKLAEVNERRLHELAREAAND